MDRQRTVVVAGSKEILDHPQEKILLAKAIGAKIIRQGWVLLTGGAAGIRETEEPTAIDYWAALGAKEEAEKLGIDPRDCIRTLHPLASDHPLHNIGSVEITKRRTPALRRFDLVAQADAIVCIEGLAGLTIILELSIALNKVLLPIPCTGGTSREIWDIYASEIMDRLNLEKKSKDYVMLMEGLAVPEALSDTVIQILKRALNPLCYVIVPGHATIDTYNDIITPVLVRSGIQPTSFDELISPISVLSALMDVIRDARLVIADITGNDPDVFFQLGIVEAMGKPIILLCQQDPNSNAMLGSPPLGLKDRKIIAYRADDKEHLQQILQQVVIRSSQI